MKLLATLYDHELQLNYDLYTINAKTLYERLIKTYSKKVKQEELQLFNADVKYFEKAQRLKAIQDGKKPDYTEKQYGDHFVDIGGSRFNIGSDKVKNEIKTSEKLNNEIEDDIESIGNKSFITSAIQKRAELGYEVMPLAVSVKDKKITDNNLDIELLDGFRRMFYTKDIPDRDILLKVYPDLTDAEWFSAMVLYNSWKFANNNNSKVYIDRGFRLGLYYRYGIDFVNYYVTGFYSYWSLIDYYTDQKPYFTFWNNELAHEDLKLIYETAEYRPVFKAKVKKKEVIFDCNKEPHTQPSFLHHISNVFIKEFGSIRRKELTNENKGETIQRKSFNLNIVTDYFQREDLQEHFLKLSEMSVGGHIENYVIKHLLNDLKDWIDTQYKAS